MEPNIQSSKHGQHFIKLNNVDEDLKGLQFELVEHDNLNKVQKATKYDTVYVTFNERMKKNLSNDNVVIHLNTNFETTTSLNDFLKFLNQENISPRNFQFNVDLYNKISSIQNVLLVQNYENITHKCIQHQDTKSICTIASMLICYEFLKNNDFYNTVNDTDITNVYTRATELYNENTPGVDGVDVVNFYNDNNYMQSIMNRVGNVDVGTLGPTYSMESFDDFVDTVKQNNNQKAGVMTCCGSSFGFFINKPNIYFFNTHKEQYREHHDCAHIAYMKFDKENVTKYLTMYINNKNAMENASGNKTTLYININMFTKK